MQSRCENYGSYCSLERLRIKQSLSIVLKPLPRLPRGVACPERRTGIGLWRGDDQPFVIQLGNPQKATNHQKDSESRPPDGFSVGPGGGRQLFHSKEFLHRSTATHKRHFRRHDGHELNVRFQR